MLSTRGPTSGVAVPVIRKWFRAVPGGLAGEVFLHAYLEPIQEK
jgi:hypothetical protein